MLTDDEAPKLDAARQPPDLPTPRAPTGPPAAHGKHGAQQQHHRKTSYLQREPGHHDVDAGVLGVKVFGDARHRATARLQQDREKIGDDEEDDDCAGSERQR